MPKNVLVIGGVALGPKAACRFKRLEPESKVTLIDQGAIISYGGCGIPYFVGGDVERWKAFAPPPPVSSALLNSSMICAMSTYSSAPAR